MNKGSQIVLFSFLILFRLFSVIIPCDRLSRLFVSFLTYAVVHYRNYIVRTLFRFSKQVSTEAPLVNLFVHLRPNSITLSSSRAG